MQLPLDVVAIQKLLPHRYPFLLVDRVTEFERSSRIVCHKSVTINEYLEIAKKYGTEESSSFVNGILDKIEKK